MGVVILPKNADAEIYFDDFVFKAKQPYESEVEIHPNNGGESIRLFGERGSEIVFPKITNQSFRLKGYFTDEACTVPFTGSVYTRQKITLYAAWENAPISFENYGFADESGKVSPTMSLLAGSGVGCKDGDDAALAFRFNGSDIYSEIDGQIVYMGSRAAMRDHSARLLQVKDKTLYRITYYYKNRPESNVSYRLFFSVSSENIWDAKSYNSGVSQTERIITKNESGWTKAEVYYKTDLKTVYGNWLFLQATLLGGGNTKVASCDIDDIFVEEIPAPYVIFEPNNEGAQVVRNGNMGDPIDFPAVKNGKAELLGWYTDEALTVPFTETTYTGEFRVYAKWSNAPISFEDYKYTADGVNIGQTMRIIRQNGVGCTDGDDAVLGFRFNGSDIYSEKDGQIVYMGSRFNMRDHNARLKQVENHAFYRITYYYRNNPETNTAYRLFFSTSSENIWETPVYVNGRESTERLVSPQENGWTKVQTYLKTDFPKAHGNWLFLQATTMSGSQNTVVSCDIDDILIEKIEPPYVVFNLQNGEESQLLQGSEGSPIVLPQTPYRHGFTFTGWYADAACTTPFTQKVFTADTETFVYAGWRQNRTVVYDFENYGCIDQDWKMQLCDVIYQHRSEAASGSGVLYVDRRTENGATLNPAGAYAGVAWGTELYETDGASYYVISAKVYVLSKGNSNFTLTGRIAGKDNLWAYGTNDTTNRAQVRRSVPTGTWTKVTFTLDASKAKKAEGRYLYLRMAGGNEGQYLVDDVTVTRLDPGEIPVVVEQVGGKTDQIPEYVSGPKGSDYSSLLPQNPKLDNILFMGYCFINDKDEYERITDTRIGEEAGRIYARLQRSVIAQNFDDGNYQAEWNRPLTYRIADFDYELYDAQAAGHSADNVTSGRYSLHRKGKTPYFENALLLTQGDELSETGRYTVTMKVKLGKHFHSDGAVKIVSNRSPYYAWTTTGDYYPIISIKDLEDGKWHEVSYTFNSVEVYASLQTPGYCELFVDDVVFTLVDENTPLSTPAEYTEYVPARRDEQGNLLGYGSGDGFDLTKIWDVSLYQKPEENPVVLILLIGGAALVLAAGAAVWLILRGKRRKKASL